MKHFGDITKMNGAEVPMVDIITGGSPCQDLSIAGKRSGLKHSDKGDDETTRSGLFMEQIRIVKEMRNECARQLRMCGANVDIRLLKPRFMVWENVPGTFSSNKGEDFRCVLEEICRVADQTATVPLPEKGKWSTSGCIVGDGWSVAWRVHDAQFWGVSITDADGRVVKKGTPQRRKRIALVADFGSERAGEILFERKSMSGDSEQNREERKDIASDTEGSSCETIGVDSYNLTTTGTVSKTLQAERSDNEHIPCAISYGIDKAITTGGNCTAGGDCIHEEYVPPLTTDRPHAISFQERAGKPGGGKGILIQNEHTGALSTLNNQSVVYGICSNNSNSMKSSNPFSGIYEADTSRTLDLNGGSPACNQGGMAVVFDASGSQRMPDKENFNAVIVKKNEISAYGIDVYNQSVTGEISKTLNSVRSDSDHVPCVATNTCFRKKAHPQKGKVQKWENTEINDTLNVFDNAETRTPTLICEQKVFENHGQDCRYKDLGDVCNTVSATYGMGGNNQPLIVKCDDEPKGKDNGKV